MNTETTDSLMVVEVVMKILIEALIRDTHLFERTTALRFCCFCNCFLSAVRSDIASSDLHGEPHGRPLSFVRLR